MGEYLWNIFRGILWEIYWSLSGQCQGGHVYNNHIHCLIDRVFWGRETCFIALQLWIAEYHITQKTVIWSKKSSGHLVAILNCLPARSDFFFISQCLAQKYSSLDLCQAKKKWLGFCFYSWWRFRQGFRLPWWPLADGSSYLVEMKQLFQA